MSKTAQLRALREAQHRPSAEQKKPARSDLQRAIDEIIAPKAPAPEALPAKPAPHVATKRKKRLAEAIGKTRPASREGKRPVMVYLEEDLALRLKIFAARSKTSMEKIVTEAIERMLSVEE